MGCRGRTMWNVVLFVVLAVLLYFWWVSAHGGTIFFHVF